MRPTTAVWADAQSAKIAQAKYYRENPSEQQLKGGTSSFMGSFTVRQAQKSKRPATAKYRAGAKGGNTLEERSRSRSKRRHEEMYSKTDLFEQKEKSDA